MAQLPEPPALRAIGLTGHTLSGAENTAFLALCRGGLRTVFLYFNYPRRGGELIIGSAKGRQIIKRVKT